MIWVFFRFKFLSVFKRLPFYFPMKRPSIGMHLMPWFEYGSPTQVKESEPLRYIWPLFNWKLDRSSKHKIFFLITQFLRLASLNKLSIKHCLVVHELFSWYLIIFLIRFGCFIIKLSTSFFSLTCWALKEFFIYQQSFYTN